MDAFSSAVCPRGCVQARETAHQCRLLVQGPLRCGLSSSYCPLRIYRYNDHSHCASTRPGILTKVIELWAQNKPLHGSDVAPGLTRAWLKDGLLCREFNASTTKTKNVQLVVAAGLQEIILTYLRSPWHLQVKARYYWPGYKLDTEKWVRECVECQRRNPPPRKPQAPLGTITASYPFEKITWDIMGPLTASERGNLYYTGGD